MGKPEGKTSLRRIRYKWQDNTKIYLSEIEWDDADWIDLACDLDRGGLL
jgi:hypothetical protein